MANWSPSVEKVSGNQRAQLSFVSALVREGRFDQALEEIEGFLEQNRDSAPIVLTKGRVLFRKGEYAHAATCFGEAARLDPSKAKTRLYAGVSYLKLGELAPAKKEFKAALELDSKLVTAYVGLADVLRREGNQKEAAAVLHDALRLDPEHARARRGLARIQHELGNLDEAASELERAVQAKPSNVTAIRNLVRLHMRGGHTEKACEVLESSLEEQGDEVALWDMLGRARMKGGDPAGAETAFREAIRIKPGRVSGHVRLIESLIAQGNADEARSALEDLPRKKVLGPVMHVFYGEIYRSQKKFKQAVESFRAALLSRPDGDETIRSVEGTDKGGKRDDWEELANLYVPKIKELRKKLKSDLETRRSKRRGTN